MRPRAICSSSASATCCCGDDGAGPAVIAWLRQTRYAPAGASRCSTAARSACRCCRTSKTRAGSSSSTPSLPTRRAGTLVRLEGGDVGPAVATRLSPHQVGVADLLDGARWHDREPERLVLLGVVPQSIELGVGLSDPVRRALPQLIDLVCAEAQAWGYPLPPAGARRHDGTFDVARLLTGAPL